MAKGCEIIGGFLMKHPCDYPATGRCISCGRRVCVGHSRPPEPGEQPAQGAPIPGPGEEPVVCTECIKQRIAEKAPQDPAAQRVDDPYYDRYYHDPFFWGTFHHPRYQPYSIHDDYDRDDYAAFDRDAEAGGFEADFGGT